MLYVIWWQVAVTPLPPQRTQRIPIWDPTTLDRSQECSFGKLWLKYFHSCPVFYPIIKVI